MLESSTWWQFNVHINPSIMRPRYRYQQNQYVSGRPLECLPPVTTPLQDIWIRTTNLRHRLRTASPSACAIPYCHGNKFVHLIFEQIIDIHLDTDFIPFKLNVQNKRWKESVLCQQKYLCTTTYIHTEICTICSGFFEYLAAKIIMELVGNNW